VNRRWLRSGVLAGIFVSIGAVVFTLASIVRSPESPVDGCRKGKGVVILGDSLTRGTIGYDIAGELRRRIGGRSGPITNAGINGDRAADVVARLNTVTACDPEKIILWVGMNDILSGDKPEKFQEQYRDVLRGVSASGHARVAVASLPLVAGGLETVLNSRIRRYSGYIRALATDAHVTYLPVYEVQRDWRAAHGAFDRMELAEPFPVIRRAFLASFRRVVLGQSWSQISAAMGSDLTIDGTHPNEVGGGLEVDLFERFLRER
jgi:lysophospholipase L1-like esterase